MHQLVDFSSTAGWTAVVYPTNATARPRPMMCRSSARHGKLQKLRPLLWHQGVSVAWVCMSNLTHVSRPFSCAAGLGAGGTDAIGLVLSAHLRASLAVYFTIKGAVTASLGIYYHWGGLHFFRRNQIYQWDTPCTQTHKQKMYTSVSVLLGFPSFARNWYLLIP